MPGPQLTRDDLNSLLIFENLCNDWVREVHRFTSERKKKKNFVIFRNCENKKLTSLDGLKEELEDVSFLENAEFKSAFSHDIVSNKVGANKRARRAAKAWMADPKKQVSNIAPVQEVTPVETTEPVVEEVRVPEASFLVESAQFDEDAKIVNETPLIEESTEESAPVSEDSIEVTPMDELKDTDSIEDGFVPIEDTPNLEVINDNDISEPDEVIPAIEQDDNAPVEEDVDDEEDEEDITVPVEEQATSTTETEIIVSVIEELVAPVKEVLVITDEEEVDTPVEETLIVENDVEEDPTIADVKEDPIIKDVTDSLEEEASTPSTEEEDTTTVEEAKETDSVDEDPKNEEVVIAHVPQVAISLPTEDVLLKLPEVALVIPTTSEEIDQIKETATKDKDDTEDIEEEPVPIVKAETERGDSVLSNTSDMGSMESLEAQTGSVSTDDNENSCSDTDIFIPTSDDKQKDLQDEDIRIEIVQV